MRTYLLAAASLLATTVAYAAPTKHLPPLLSPRVIVPAGQSGGTPATVALIYSPFNGVTLSKGVAVFSSPGTGIYCLTPASHLRATALPVVEVEWSNSTQVLNEAQWVQTPYDCNSGDIEVITVDQSTGTFASDVAFVVTVQ